LSIRLEPQQLIDKMEFEALCNVTERVWEVTKRTAPITHWLSAHADKLKFAQQYRTGWAQWCNDYYRPARHALSPGTARQTVI